MNLAELFKYSSGRQAFFEVLSQYPKNWQCNITPNSIVNKMVNKTSLDNKKILVLFNIEFIDKLLSEKDVASDNIYYIADNQLELLSAKRIYNVHSYCSSIEDGIVGLKKLIQSFNMKFDLVFTNPPYNNNTDIKILNEIIDCANEWVIVHPSTWVIDDKNKTNLYVNFKNKINKKISSVDFFNGNPVFNIALYVPCMITHINHKLNSNCKVNYFGTVYDIENIHSFNKYGENWKLVESFKNEILSEISSLGHVWSHIVSPKNIDQDLFYCQLAGIRGNVNLKSSSIDIVKDDFYTFVMKDLSANLNVRKDDIKCTFAFNSENERLNFLNYLTTDFARFCLSIYKTNSHLDRGELEIVPWLDYNEEWDDEKLFLKFNVSDELQKFIREFLPDYHNIRK